MKQGGFPPCFFQIYRLYIKTMARGSAAKSAAGNAMSKYDVEVEARLKVIESRLAEIEVKLHELKSAPAPAAHTVVAGDINVEALAKILRLVEPNFDRLQAVQHLI